MRRLALVGLAAGLLSGAAYGAQGDPIERHAPADMANARAGLLKGADLGSGWTAQPSGDDRCNTFHPDHKEDHCTVASCKRHCRNTLSLRHICFRMRHNC